MRKRLNHEPLDSSRYLKSNHRRPFQASWNTSEVIANANSATALDVLKDRVDCQHKCVRTVLDDHFSIWLDIVLRHVDVFIRNVAVTLSVAIVVSCITTAVGIGLEEAWLQVSVYLLVELTLRRGMRTLKIIGVMHLAHTESIICVAGQHWLHFIPWITTDFEFLTEAQKLWQHRLAWRKARWRPEVGAPILLQLCWRNIQRSHELWH